jgi:hypothetical protein
MYDDPSALSGNSSHPLPIIPRPAWRDARRTEKIARSIFGVLSVENKLRLEREP